MADRVEVPASGGHDICAVIRFALGGHLDPTGRRGAFGEVAVERGEGSADEAGQRVAARRAPSAVGPAASMRGRVRLGSVRISRDTGGVGLLLAPGSGTGCDACNLLDVPEIGEEDSACGAGTDSIEGSSDTTALLLAGDMAALAVCRWILDIGADATPRGLWLTNGGAVFAAVGARRRLPCPRACGA